MLADVYEKGKALVITLYLPLIYRCQWRRQSSWLGPGSEPERSQCSLLSINFQLWEQHLLQDMNLSLRLERPKKSFKCLCAIKLLFHNGSRSRLATGFSAAASTDFVVFRPA